MLRNSIGRYTVGRRDTFLLPATRLLEGVDQPPPPPPFVVAVRVATDTYSKTRIMQGPWYLQVGAVVLTLS